MTCSRPTPYHTVQLKGGVVAVREPTAEQLAAVDKHVEAFSREAEQVGLPPGSGRRLKDPGLVAVTMEEPPARLLLGSDAYAYATAAARAQLASDEQCLDLSRSTDRDDATAAERDPLGTRSDAAV